MSEYQKMEQYVDILPCGCGGNKSDNEELSAKPLVHPTLRELLDASPSNIKMNHLDYKRRKKLLHNVEALKGWISKQMDFDETKRYQIVKELNKIARAFKQMAIDVNKHFSNENYYYLNFVFLFQRHNHHYRMYFYG
jgi:hypothetical protein